MLFVDGEKLDLKDKDNPLVQQYLETKKYFDRLGYPLIFRINPDYTVTRNCVLGNIHGTKKKEISASSHFIPYVSRVYEDNIGGGVGTELEWRYSPIMPRRKGRDGEYSWPENGEWVHGKVFKITKEEVDKAFFLYKKSSVITKSKVYVLRDVNKYMDDAVKEKERKGFLDYYIYSPLSPINQDSRLLRTVSRSFGVVDVDKKTDNVLKVELERAVKEGEKKGRGYDAFSKAIQLDSYTVVRANVQRAKEEGLIVCDNHKNRYYYTDTKEKICNIDNLSEADDELAAYLINNKDAMLVFNNTLGVVGEEENNEKKEEIKEALSTYSRNELLAKAKECGVGNPALKKSDKLIEIIADIEAPGLTR